MIKSVVIVVLIFMSFTVTAETEKYLINGKLARCPDKPNCVNTEEGDIQAVNIDDANLEYVWSQLIEVIQEQGGNIKKSNKGYLWATFQTSWLKFTDDVEARFDSGQGVIHLKSASRVGYYDFGTNQNRLTQLIKRFSIKLTQSSRFE